MPAKAQDGRYQVRGVSAGPQKRVSAAARARGLSVSALVVAAQRTPRSESELVRTTISNTLSEVLRLLSERIGNFEALIEARIERVETWLDHLAAQLTGMTAQLDRIERRP
jgi:hypothetical protein